MANLLIVDDELGMRQFLTHLFQREGHVVRVAENGRVALEQLREQTPDLIISDYRLRNGKTGIEAIARLREAVATPIPAFLMSGDTDLDVVRQAEESGLPLLHKPVEPAALRTMLADTLKRPAITTNDVAGVA